ncbi:hypothetical protein [Klebsiella pneumoniae]|nr:hypothetical protein [Klebsiella pneumoniae]
MVAEEEAARRKKKIPHPAVMANLDASGTGGRLMSGADGRA